MYKEKIILQEDPDTIEVSLSPDKTPHAYAQKVKELMESCGLSKEEAEAEALRPIVLELVYEKDCGLFAIEVESVDCSFVWSPYTQKILTVKQ